MQEAS